MLLLATQKPGGSVLVVSTKYWLARPPLVGLGLVSRSRVLCTADFISAVTLPATLMILFSLTIFSGRLRLGGAKKSCTMDVENLPAGNNLTTKSSKSVGVVTAITPRTRGGC